MLTRLVDMITIATEGFRGIAGKVSLTHEACHGFRPRIDRGQTDTRTDLEGTATARKPQRLNSGQHFPRQFRRIFKCAVIQYNSEFIAAQACEDVRLAQTALQQLSYIPE